MVGEFTQQSVFGARQGKFTAGLQHDAEVTPNLEIGNSVEPRQGCRRGGPLVQLSATQRRTDPRCEFLGDNRLRHVIIRTGFEARDQIVCVRLRRHHDDRGHGVRPDLTAHVKAGNVGQTQIEQHQIGRHLVEFPQPRRTVGSLDHFVALVLERQPKSQADVVVVFDEKEPMHGAHSADRRTRVLKSLHKTHRIRPASSQSSGILIAGWFPPGGSLSSPFCGPPGGRFGHTWCVSTPTRREDRTVKLGLRARTLVSFGLIALVTSMFAGIATYSFSRSSLIDQRFEATRSQALGNAQVMRTLLLTRRNLASQVITTIRTESRGYALVRIDPQNFFYATDPLSFTQADLPESLVASVTTGRAATQRFDHDGELYQGFGIPMPSVGADYYEVFPLRETQRTLSFILSALLAGLIVATAIAIALGWFTSRRLLLPVRRVVDAAADIAGGRLDARLEPEDDPDLNRLAVTFNEMADTVQERIEREVRFASDVSHELRSPITALSAAIDVLAARRSELSDRNQQALDVVTTQVRRFDRMVIDLLELSRLDSGTSVPRYETVEIADFIRRIAQRSGFGTVPIVASGIIHDHITSDRLRLERIIVNLLVNAREHAEGPVAILIDGRLDSVAITVVDEGPGIPETDRQRIFNRFARGSSAARGTGTGLGLSIALEHAVALGGTIRIEDNTPRGMRFTLEIPTEPDGAEVVEE